MVLSGEVAGILGGGVQLEGVDHGRLGLRRKGFVGYNPATVLAHLFAPWSAGMSEHISAPTTEPKPPQQSVPSHMPNPNKTTAR